MNSSALLYLAGEWGAGAVHPTAIIADGAEIGAGTRVGPYSVIGPHVRLCRDNIVGPHVVLAGTTSIGDRNQIYQFASVGAPPQDLKWRGETAGLVIGSDNIIREYVTIQPGVGPDAATRLGHGNLLMASTHIGHDCQIGDGNCFSNCATLAGHVAVGDHVNFGGLSAVHQFARIGDHAFLGGGAMVAQDIPPFCLAQGDRAALIGINEIGLRRHGFADDDIRALRWAFRRIFRGEGVRADRIAAARNELGTCPSVCALIGFIVESTRGVAPARALRSLTESEASADNSG
ncbi:MAG TPA: acyl-ACP--UDP-N-acetylglucosamine O-acyltransferase [Aliidongia sp.]|nr:acyl-ACP--UDP-N-acetylglucosamine O-acyltransferase [Aliidongia sp.]